MIRMPYRTCLLAALSVLNCVGAAAPSATPVKMEPAPGMKSGRALTTAPSPEDCAALNDRSTCKKTAALAQPAAAAALAQPAAAAGLAQPAT